MDEKFKDELDKLKLYYREQYTGDEKDIVNLHSFLKLEYILNCFREEAHIISFEGKDSRYPALYDYNGYKYDVYSMDYLPIAIINQFIPRYEHRKYDYDKLNSAFLEFADKYIKNLTLIPNYFLVINMDKQSCNFIDDYLRYCFTTRKFNNISIAEYNNFVEEAIKRFNMKMKFKDEVQELFRESAEAYEKLKSK